MNPTAAFPIMMGSCAFLMPVSAVRFVRTRIYHARATMGLALGGVPAVLLAAFVFSTLSVDAVRWLVVPVVVYTSLNMLLTSREPERASEMVGVVASAGRRHHRGRRRDRPRARHAHRT